MYLPGQRKTVRTFPGVGLLTYLGLGIAKSTSFGLKVYRFLYHSRLGFLANTRGT